MKAKDSSKFVVERVPNEAVDDFISNHSVTVNTRTSEVKVMSLGLFNDGSLLGIAEFCYPVEAKDRNKYSTQLLQLCFSKDISIKLCKTHGLVNHSGEKCRKCSKERSMTLKECPTHDMTLHRGKSCCKCSAMKTAHTKFHKTTPHKDCFMCTTPSRSSV